MGNRTKPWKVSVQREGRKIQVGHFTTAEDAAQAYDKALRSCAPDRASLLRGLNFPVKEDYFCLETWQEQPVPKEKTSRFLNVGWHRQARKFVTRSNGGMSHVGYFACELDAAFAADRASLKYGE